MTKQIRLNLCERLVSRIMNYNCFLYFIKKAPLQVKYRGK
jgi:hypothetical protein